MRLFTTSIIIFTCIISSLRLSAQVCEDFTLGVRISNIDPPVILSDQGTINNLCLTESDFLIPIINPGDQALAPDCPNPLDEYEILWRLPGSSQFTASTCITFQGYGSYTLRAPCTQAGSTVFKDVSFTLNDPSTCAPVISITGIDCAADVSSNGQTVSLTATLDGTQPANTTVEWLLGNSIQGTGLSIDIPIPASGQNPSYEVRLVDDNNDEILSTASITLSGIDFNPSISVTANPATVCEGETALLTANNPDNFDLRWRDSNNQIIPNTNNDPSISILAGTYTLEAISDYGCTIQTSITVNSTDKPGAPTVATPNQTEFCQGETATLSIVDPDDNLSYNWQRSGFPNFSATGSSLPITETGFYRATASDNGCESDLSNGFNIEFEVYEEPTFVGPTSSPCEGESVSIYLNSLNADYEVSWSTGDTGPSTMVSMGGSYSYTIEFGNECANTEMVTVPEFAPIPILPIQIADPVDAGSEANIPIDFGTDDISLVYWEVLDEISAQSVGRNGEISEDLLNLTINGSGSERSTGAIIIGLTPQSSDECVGDTTELLIRVIPNAEEPFIPQIISPNGDGANDEWVVLFPQSDATYNIAVYSRGGGQVFSGTQAQLPWDTGDCPNGTYYYQINEANGEGVWQGALSIIGKQ